MSRKSIIQSIQKDTVQLPRLNLSQFLGGFKYIKITSITWASCIVSAKSIRQGSLLINCLIRSINIRLLIDNHYQCFSVLLIEAKKGHKTNPTSTSKWSICTDVCNLWSNSWPQSNIDRSSFLLTSCLQNIIINSWLGSFICFGINVCKFYITGFLNSILNFTQKPSAEVIVTWHNLNNVYFQTAKYRLLQNHSISKNPTIFYNKKLIRRPKGKLAEIILLCYTEARVTKPYTIGQYADCGIVQM